MSFLSSDAVESSSSSYSPPPCRQFAFSEILHATQNFKESLVIGRGGFGTVYRVTITCEGSLLYAAIKRLESTSNQGAAEFWGEVKTLSKLRHSHLVSLFGYCNDGEEMILVYEYMPNGTLADHLHKGRAPLTWECRLEISIGAARGLDYLHTGTGIKHGVIHRDVKSTNILLDYNWAAKISDFGLSKIGDTNQQSSSIYNTFIKGTYGYLDPAYYQTGRLTRKSDVYAFGVVLFEVLCGKQAVDSSIDEDQWSLAAWAQDSIKKGRLKHIVDSNLRGVVSQKRLKQFAKLANRCLHTEPKQRPTMAEVVKGLESILTVRETTSGTLFSQPFVRRGPTSTFSPLPLDTYSFPKERNQLVFFKDPVYNIDLEDLLEASAEVLGDGSFGRTYKQVLQEKNKTVALKRLKDVVVTENEFRTKMEVLGNMKNKNVVPLIAYYYSKDEKWLVYDYMPAGSLSALLHGNIGSPPTQLDWDHRMRISLSAARGLAYLHMAAKVVHGNIKSSNILIQHESNNYQACLSHYGLNIFFRQSSSLNSHVTAYWAPEVHSIWEVTFASDVYSFGILLMELLTGKDPNHASVSKEGVHFSELLEEVVRGEPRVDIFDVELRTDHRIETVMRLLQIAKDCLSIVPNQRPTMYEMLSKMEDMWLWTDHSEGYDYTPSTETHDTPSTITL